ncbi:LysR family transcriptional regulator [Herbaspirillum sp. SJZ107]|uniref:LysR family transcriptional regulator n=1 Tax=Herbaspirillum sp. SJZ107 TaxID=2572881 RepID=UPI00114DCBE2|nr:LysR family transcriptional regulator [Herbaspirillum sp. SJZ107]TQK08054.1 LysR family transcriptional regulator [Herbaspirillum sp. SJZ107]
MINYKHLQYFYTVATSGTVAAAAARLHVSAQAISTQLQLLEDQFGEALFRKKGRVLELTDAGKTVLLYAERIFDLGNELEQNVRRGLFRAPETLRVGVCDMIPKTMAFRLLQPAHDAGLAMRLVCREGGFDALMLELGAHRLDLVIADRGLPPGSPLRGHTHLLGSSTLTVLGHPDLCAARDGLFPQCLKGAPFLLPGVEAAVHSRLQAWFERHGLRPIVVGEFDDGALLNAFARAGTGFIAAPTVLAAAICAEYGLRPLGTVDSIVEQFHAVTVERRIDHPAVRRILEGAGSVFASAVNLP